MSVVTMSTSDSSRRDPTTAVASDASAGDLAGALSLAPEIERLANQFFGGVPGPAMNAGSAPSLGIAPAAFAPGPVMPPGVGPHAMNVGAGGASPAVVAPPVPGWIHRPPLAASPIPKESDLRAIPTQISEQLGTP